MKADMPPAIRKRLIVSGNVQEAGYRVFVKPIAKSMGIAGFVRNLPDETVEVVCEAEPKTLEKFIKAIDRKGNPANPHDINVASIVETPAPEGGKYATFKIEYDGTLSPEEREQNREIREERMIVGASILNEKVDGLGQKMDGVGKAVEGVGQKVDGLGQKMDCLGQKMDGVGKDVRDVGQAVKGMHFDMNTRFDHMAQRYDLIATSLVKAIDRIDEGFEKMDKSSKRTDKAIDQSRKDAAASNRELASAVRFMIRKLSDKPARKRPAGKRKR
jgi:acylphosphatase/uncharacterized protein YoxC